MKEEKTKKITEVLKQNKYVRNYHLRTYKSLDAVKTIFNSNKDYFGNDSLFYYIEHNKDVLENGESNKRHIHIIIRFKNKRSMFALADLFCLEVGEYIDAITDLLASIRYLIHFDNDNKFKYEFNDIITNDISILKYFESDNIRSKLPEQIAKMRAVFDTVDLFISGEITFKELLLEHPQFLYKMYNLRTIIELRAQDLGFFEYDFVKKK